MGIGEPMAHWDYIVCGGGIAGLYTAYKLMRDPDLKILILYETMGGKIATQTVAVPTDQPTETFTLELGAAKFAESDVITNALIRELELSHMVVPYMPRARTGAKSVYIDFKEGKDRDGFYGMLPVVSTFDVRAEFLNIFRVISLLKISTDAQLRTTLYELLRHTIYPYIYKGHRCTYGGLDKHTQNEIRNRLKRLMTVHPESDFHYNAWVAIRVIHKQYRKSAADITLSPDRGGMSQIMRELLGRLSANQNIRIRRLHVTSIDLREKTVTAREVRSGSNQLPYKFECTRDIVIAIPAENLRNIAAKNKFYDKRGNVERSIFGHVCGVPLMRIYAKINFHGGGIIIRDIAPNVTVSINNPITRIMPYDYDNQIYMVQVDGSDARTWGRILDDGEDSVARHIEKYLEEVGFKCNVAWSASHYWPNGVYHWKPDADPLGVSWDAIGLGIVGSSFAMKQTSIEGALSTCDEWLNLRREN